MPAIATPPGSSATRPGRGLSVAHETIRTRTGKGISLPTACCTAHDCLAGDESVGFLEFFRVVLSPFLELRNERLQAHSQGSQPIVDTLGFLDESLSVDEAMFLERPKLLN